MEQQAQLLPEVVAPGAEAQPMAHEVASAAPAHFAKHSPQVGLETMMAITAASGPPGLLDKPTSSVMEHSAWPKKNKRETSHRHRACMLCAVRKSTPYAVGTATRSRRIAFVGTTISISGRPFPF
jgi:hypothetical protein